jgi:hypothetical protein
MPDGTRPSLNRQPCDVIRTWTRFSILRLSSQSFGISSPEQGFNSLEFAQAGFAKRGHRSTNQQIEFFVENALTQSREDADRLQTPSEKRKPKKDSTISCRARLTARVSAIRISAPRTSMYWQLKNLLIRQSSASPLRITRFGHLADPSWQRPSTGHEEGRSSHF